MQNALDINNSMITRKIEFRKEVNYNFIIIFKKGFHLNINLLQKLSVQHIF